MASSTNSDIKKKRGRPPKPGGIAPGVFVRLAPAIIEAVDQVAKAKGVTRSDVIRRLVELGLKAKGGKR